MVGGVDAGARRDRTQGVFVTWQQFRAGTGARTKNSPSHCLSSSIPVSLVLSIMQHDVHSVKPDSIHFPRLLTIAAYLDNWTHSLMPRDTAHDAFVSFTGDVED